MRWVRSVAAIVLVLAAGGYAAFQLSPWPSVLLIRHVFHKAGMEANAALEKHTPPNVKVVSGIRYGPAADQLLDIYVPEDGATDLGTVLWVHGGGFVAGGREEIANYMKIVAARGYAMVAIDYTRAPAARYPTPVRQANDALAFLVKEGSGYGIGTERVAVAGDSAGAQIAAQLASALTDAGYAAALGIVPALPPDRLKGAILFCGIYDAASVQAEGAFGGFIKTVTWAYFGVKDSRDDTQFEQFSVPAHVTSSFPPAFVSVGNADPLAPQSALLAQVLTEKGVDVETLFFPAERAPPLPHEYQFNLDDEAGMTALQRLDAFLARTIGKPQS